MVKVPKYKKIGGKRRELINPEKGMIIAFFAIFRVFATVSTIIGRPWSSVKNFLHRYYKRGTIEIFRGPVGPKSLPDATSE